jgi:hypothetical protein
VNFRCENEAQAFADRLQARLDAPNNLQVSHAEILAELPATGEHLTSDIK